ncbi:hypothetical protein PIB30_023151, partial [Stylosanthes scabra]|nr:hypothetical protein [Stylosanthes scabra]
ELHEWRLKYQKKFGYAFVACASGKSSDEILSELKETEEKYDDISHVVEDVTLNSFEVNSLGTDHATEFENYNDPLEHVTGSNENQSRAKEHLRPERGFDLNKEPWWGLDISDPVKRETYRFLTEYVTPGKYDTRYF